jgi:hypothetical protein
MQDSIDNINRKPHFSGAEKHPDFRVTLCGQNDTTNVDFAHIESYKTSIFCKNLNISQKFFGSIGLSIW